MSSRKSEEELAFVCFFLNFFFSIRNHVRNVQFVRRSKGRKNWTSRNCGMKVVFLIFFLFFLSSGFSGESRRLLFYVKSIFTEDSERIGINNFKLSG